MFDISTFMDECNRSPRLNELKVFFKETASGQSGKPKRRATGDKRLIESDDLINQFIDLHSQRMGPFDLHYHASIPYRLEEEYRLGHAILCYGNNRSSERGPMNVYSLGTAEGTMARTISELADGSIETLSCSPNSENAESFFSYGDPPHAAFFVGPFHHLTRDVIQSRSELEKFTGGFDVILEDTTFQMYSPNRIGQIGFVNLHLKPDGVFIFVEKFRHADSEEYERREKQKDFGYKSRFFEPREIEQKTRSVLSTMSRNENTLEEMRLAVSKYFKYCYITWNSGNFYTLVASNNQRNIKAFLSNMIPPAIPSEYVYVDIPTALLEANRDRD